jgi:hypothetical protein
MKTEPKISGGADNKKSPPGANQTRMMEDE